MRLHQKIFYGIAELGLNGLEVFLRLYSFIFFNEVLNIEPTWIGLILGLSIFWDALIDPWIGKLSDQYRNSHGSRKLFILVGTVLTALTVYITFNPPLLVNLWERMSFAITLTLFLSSSTTLLSIPYSALVGDLSSDRLMRTHLIGWRLGFANIGSIVGIALPAYLLLNKQDFPEPYGLTGSVLAILVLATGLISYFFSAKEIPVLLNEKNNSFHFFQVLKNKAFLLLFAAYFVVNIGLTFNSAVALYFYRLRLQLSEQHIQIILLGFLLLFTFFVPLWIYFSKRWGKRNVLLVGAIALGLNQVFLIPLIPSNQFSTTFLIASLLGGFFVASSVLLESVLTDVIEYDQVKTKQENFGFYFGLWRMSSKFSRAFAVTMTGFFLQWASVTSPNQDTSFRLAIIFGPIVGLCFIIAGCFLFYFKLNEKKMLQVQRILKKRETQ